MGNSHNINEAVNDAASAAVRWSVFEAMEGAVYYSMSWTLSQAVSWAVRRAVEGATSKDPDHPALEDFLREAL